MVENVQQQDLMKEWVKDSDRRWRAESYDDRCSNEGVKCKEELFEA